MVLYQGDHLLVNGKLHAVISTDPAADIAYTIDVIARDALPQKHSHELLRQHAVDAAEHGVARLLDRQAASNFASAASIALRDRAWVRIEVLVKDAMILEAGPRWRLVQARAHELHCAPTTLLRDLRRYWQNGQSRDALLGHYDRCGSNATPGGKARGRKPKNPMYKKYAQTKKDFENYKEVIEEFYLKEGVFVTIPDTLLQLYTLHYREEDGNGELTLKGEGEKPTQRQFEYYLRKHYAVDVRKRSRLGDKKFELNDRAVLGTVADACHGVGHIYELDASIADIHLVSELDRADLVGRPVVYLIVDRHTKLIVGWYLGLENASWPAALQAIFSLVDDKEAICNRLGVPYSPEDWPAHGILPQEFVMDRGEGIGREPTKLCDAAQTTVTNLPSFRGDWKPLVEGSFAWMHRALTSTDGYQPASLANRRRTKDNGLDGTHTVQEFESLLVTNIIARNRTVHASHVMTRDEIAHRVEPSPINLWNHGVRTRAGHLARFSPEVLRMKLLPQARAMIDEKGIVVDGRYYKPETVDRNSWFVEGRRRTTHIEVSFDMRRVDRIYVHDRRERGGFFVAMLTSRSERFAGLSVDEAKHMAYAEFFLKGSARQSRAENLIKARLHATAIQDQAKEKTKAAMKNKRRSSRRDNLVQARADAKNMERDRLGAPVFAATEDSQPAEPAPRLVPPSVETKVVALRPTWSPDPAKPQDAVVAEPLTPAERARQLRQKMIEGA